jgi:hypothetical protein
MALVMDWKFYPQDKLKILINLKFNTRIWCNTDSSHMADHQWRRNLFCNSLYLRELYLSADLRYRTIIWDWDILGILKQGRIAAQGTWWHPDTVSVWEVAIRDDCGEGQGLTWTHWQV